MPSSAEEMLALFVTFQKNVDHEQHIRESILETVQGLEKLVRQMMTILQGIHLESGITECSKIIEKANDLAPQFSSAYTNLSTAVPQKEYYRYHELWRSSTQRAVFCITLIHYLSKGELATRDFVADKLSLNKNKSEGFHLDLEDYLHGLLQLVSELARLAVNSAASGDYQRPVTISQFVNELNAGFRLINFKNDSLRKHYDCLKYDLKKIEDVVYDLSIRGLKTPSKPTPNEEEGS